MSVNKKIIDLLRVLNIPQAALAEKLGMAQSNLNRLLNSEDLKVSQLIEISKSLNVSPSHFFDGSETINKNELDACKKRVEELEEMLSDKRKIIQDNQRTELMGYIRRTENTLNKNFNLKKDTKTLLINKVYETIEKHIKSGKAGILWLCDFDNEDEIIRFINEELEKISPT
ncbi:MAG: hypothetical protein JWO32_1553 [Bacteroidetes bacterium]|nr:hypothetical protein [Bacteroidota bacterium]